MDPNEEKEEATATPNEVQAATTNEVAAATTTVEAASAATTNDVPAPATHAAATVTVHTNKEGESYFDLSSKKRLTVRTWKGSLLLDIREVLVLYLYFVFIPMESRLF